jgi:hypothetical protein
VADRLGQLGYSQNQIAGVMGNIHQESGFRSTAHNTTGENSFGLFQWNTNGGRQQAFRNWAAANGRDVNDPITQVDYFHHELQTSERAAGQRLRGAGSVYEANQAMRRFERYGDDSFESRLGHANRYQGWLAQRGQQQPGQQPQPQSQAPTAQGGAAATHLPPAQTQSDRFSSGFNSGSLYDSTNAVPHSGVLNPSQPSLGEQLGVNSIGPRVNGKQLNEASGKASLDQNYPEAGSNSWKSSAAKESVQSENMPTSQAQPQTEVPKTSFEDHFADGFPGLGNDVSSDSLFGMAA